MKTPAFALLLAAAAPAMAAAQAAVSHHGLPPMPLAPPAIPTYAVTAQHALGGVGGWDYLSLDPAAHHLFIARDDRVMVVDTTSGKLLAEIPGMQHAHGVALIPMGHRGYVSNGHGDNITVIDTDTFKVTGHIAVSGKDPDAIIVDAASGHVLAMNGHSNNISVIDPVAGRELTTIALPSNPEFAVSDGKGNLWVNLEDSAQLAHIDLNTNKLLQTWSLAPCEGPTGLAFDAGMQRLFSVCANGMLIVTDATNGHHVAEIAIGKRPDAVAWDAERKLVLSSNGEGTLSVVQQYAQHGKERYRVAATVPTLKSARTLALDADTHEVFLVGAQKAGKGMPVEGFEVLVVGGK
ncbi:YncE family protein [Rhodanobacter terrae]|uniref:YncE family protein n=1 Tax=Rhodanobacter terrae TaxID=418647 RepID=A0ABW0T129_9GAMM